MTKPSVDPAQPSADSGGPTLVAQARPTTEAPNLDGESVRTVIEFEAARPTLTQQRTFTPRPTVTVRPTITARSPRSLTPEIDGTAEHQNAGTIVELAAGAVTSVVASSEGITAPAARPSTQVRYDLVGEIGRGGGGDVFEVKDNDLKRHVALKRLRKEHIDRGLLALFLQEAQLTAQLEHPNIVPVHELGCTATGEPFFTMKRVIGQTLHDVLVGVARREPAFVARFSRTRLLVVFLEITRGVAHAHARGVVHCDLKPANVLIGNHGETLVADWGLATPDRLPPEPILGGAQLAPVEWPAEHIDMGVSGTLHAFAPEQAQHLPFDRRIDVYALGVILYELLTGERPFAWKNLAEAAAPRSLPVPPRVRAPHKDISDELEAICLKCLQPNPNDRYGGAGALSLAIENALTGSRRRQQAQHVTSEAQAQLATMRALQTQQAAVQQEIASLLDVIKPWDGEDVKAPLWAAEQRLQQLELAVDETLASTLDCFNQALGLDPGFVQAEDALADLHLELFLEAEAHGRHRDLQFHRRLVERHHRGRHAAVLAGRGVVTLRPRINGIDATGARITGVVLVEQGKRIVAGDALLLPDGVVHELSVPMGSVLFTVTPPPHDPPLATTTVHVYVGRSGRVDLDVNLVPHTALVGGHAGGVHIPAGPFLAGGDAEAQNAGPRREVVLPDFVIAKTPVTCAEYLVFLNDIARTDLAAARRHVPRTKPEGGALWEPDEHGVYALPTNDADGNPVIADAPVMGVSFFDAEAYCAWKARLDGVPWRLPTEDEWEKAARGVDGRFFPWGNGFDPTFCKMATSRPGRPQPEAVMSYPVDVSVYGVADTAGGIREWCNSYYDATKETRTLRGGAWYFNPSFCRTAFRHGYLPHIVFTNFGFRLARDVPTLITNDHSG